MQAAPTAVGAADDKISELLYIYVTEDGADGKISYAQSLTMDEFSNSKEFKESLKFRKTSTAGLPIGDPNIRRYSRFHLKNIFQFMGCKPLQALEITESIFKVLNRMHFERPATKEWDKQTSDGASLPKSQFYLIVRSALASFQYAKPEIIQDFKISCGVHDRKHSFVILLGGTSGCGKSTLASLLASRIGFTTVISSDHLRHMLRGFVSKEQSPILWASTYHAGECMSFPDTVPYKEQIIKGWEQQCELLYEKLDNVICSAAKRKESMIVEGVHLSSDIVRRLVTKHPNCIPFLIFISNEAKHRERFAIRAKYMTIDPRHNKYVKYIKNIRVISDHLCKTADQLLIPKIDNTNIDRSLAAIHSIIFCCIRRYLLHHEPFWDSTKNQCVTVHQEFEKQAFHSSTKMLRYLEMKARANAANLMAAAGVAADTDTAADNNNESDSSDDSYDGGSIGS